MKMKCLAGNCFNYCGAKNKLSCFRLPTDPELRQRWIDALPKTRHPLRMSARLCEEHFRDDEMIPRAGGGHRLVKGAVPSIFKDYQKKKKVTPSKDKNASGGVRKVFKAVQNGSFEVHSPDTMEDSTTEKTQRMPSKQQREYIINYIDEHRELLMNRHWKENRQGWIDLANALNSIEGASKSVAEWRKTWTDLALRAMNRSRCLKNYDPLEVEKGKIRTENELKLASIIEFMKDMKEKEADKLDESINIIEEEQQQQQRITVRPDLIDPTFIVSDSSDVEQNTPQMQNHVPYPHQAHMYNMGPSSYLGRTQHQQQHQQPIDTVIINDDEPVNGHTSPEPEFDAALIRKERLAIKRKRLELEERKTLAQERQAKALRRLAEIEEENTNSLQSLLLKLI